MLLEANDAAAKLSKHASALEEGVRVWREKATAKLLSQVNITIFCPRAECNVNGQSVEMDGWNPEVLKREFEREVLPRFTKIFVDQVDTSSTSSRAASSREQAANKASQEFAEAFRQRLKVML